jgi:hypothetical protein
MRRASVVSVVVTALFLGGASTAWGASVTLCVPSSAGGTVTSAGGAGCSSGTPVQLPSSSAEQRTLIDVLPYLSFSSSGIDGKPTIQVSGANLQIIDGSGSTTSVNGTGNLVIGYDESPGTQTGSHDLILGTKDSFTHYSELIDGYDDDATGAYGVTLGEENSASGSYATVTGGLHNHATASWSSVTGGDQNNATGSESSVTGGAYNTAAAGYGAVTGGCSNLAGRGSVTFNVHCNNSSLGADFTSVAGGDGNQANALDGSVDGGQENVASGIESAVSGGVNNNANGGLTSILGGVGEDLSTFEDSQAGSSVFTP